MATPSTDARAILFKIVALLALIVGGDVWATHHFGLGMMQLAVVGGAAAVVSAVLPFVTAALTATEKKGIAKTLQGLARFALRTPLLVGLYVAATMVALTVSTVRVVGEGEMPPVALTFLDRAGQSSADSSGTPDAVRFTVLTTPFGSLVRVTAAGFAPATFTVYPLGGLTVQLGRDLPLLPTVLFRPGTLALQALVNGGTIRAWVVAPGTPALVAETTEVLSSFVVGDPHVIPITWIEEWRLELTCEEAVIRDQALLAWRRPTRLRARTTRPAPGDRVRVEVRAVDSTLIAETEIVMTADPLIEVPLVNRSGIC